MTREQARYEINSRLTLELLKAKKTGYICPLCGNGGGSDGTGITTKDGIHWKCFKGGCEYYGDYLDYLKKQYNETESEIFRRYGLTIDSDTASTSRLSTPPTSLTMKLYYSKKRGSVSNTEYHNVIIVRSGKDLKQAVEWDHVCAEYRDGRRSKDTFLQANAVMMDVDNEHTENGAEWKNPAHVKNVFSGVAFYVVYSRNHNREKGGKPPRPRFHVYFPIDIVTDAEIYRQLKEAAREHFPAFDAGATDAARFFFGVKSPQVEAISGNYNLTQFLQAYPAPEQAPAPMDEAEDQEAKRERAAKKKVEADQEAYFNTSVYHKIAAFTGAVDESANTPAIKTGFNELDAALDGGLYAGLYIVGAISSLGKTTLILQAADQIAQRGNDVILFSLEMSRYELMAKSISRLTFEHCDGIPGNAKTTRGILAGVRWKGYSKAETALIGRSLAIYAGYTKRMYIHEGVGDIGVEQIREIVQKHISITGNRPVVIIDYLQIIAPHDTRATDKQIVDRAVLELKRLSRDEKIPIIAISSFNRENYTSPVNMASFKESGAVEYSSDVLIGIQLAGMDELSQSDSNRAKTIKAIEDMKKADPRKAQLKILKNRNGKIGINLYYNYYPMFNTFRETDNAQTDDDLPF